jgi:hypothetical protein
MALPSFARETITRLRYPSADDMGTDMPDFTAEPEALDITGCWAEPIRSIENLNGRMAVQTGWTVAAPPGVDIVSTDHVRYRGDEYEVVGDAIAVPSPSGALDATSLILRRWEG